MQNTRYFVYASLLSVTFFLSPPTYANATPGCCEDHTARLKKLEEKAVTSASTKIQLSGWLNRYIMSLDNGIDRNITHVDSGNYSSRFKILASHELNKETSLKTVLEIGMNPNSSYAVDLNNSQSNATSQSKISIRHVDILLKNINFGELQMGRGYMSQAGASYETDFSDTDAGAAGMSAPCSTGYALQFVDKDTKQKYTSLPSGLIFDTADISRKDRIRYNTPAVFGFTAHTSHAHQNRGDIFDAAVRYNQEFAGAKIAGFASWLKDRSTPALKYQAYHLAAGALLPIRMTEAKDTGLNIHFGTGKKTWKIYTQKGHIYFGKIGWIERFHSLGRTCLALDYGIFNHMSIDSNNIAFRPRGKSFGLTLVQHIEPVSTQIIAAYRDYHFKNQYSNARYHKAHTVMLGMGVKL